jgi:hypothetical protein
MVQFTKFYLLKVQTFKSYINKVRFSDMMGNYRSQQIYPTPYNISLLNAHFKFDV